MARKFEDLLAPEENAAVILRLKEELARRRISRQQLAEQAKLSISIVEKTLSGGRHLSLATLVRLEAALGITLRKNTVSMRANDTVAPTELGAYTRAAVAWLEGDYLTLRPSLSDRRAVYAYRTAIRWDSGVPCLVFAESDRVDAEFAQSGRVSVPHLSGHVYLVTSEQGQYRLITLSRPTIHKAMYGILSTLQAGSGAQLTPLATPIVLVRLKENEVGHSGKIESGHPSYLEYRALLDLTMSDCFAFIVTPD